MKQVIQSVKTGFNKAANRYDRFAESYHHSMSVTAVASTGLIGLGGYGFATAFAGMASIGAGSSMAALWGIIVMGGVVTTGAAYVVLPLIAASFAVEGGVKLYNKSIKLKLVPEIAKV